ncbi:MAG: hypothetical protein WA659_01555 [Candidatus Aquirickettsiella sp.]
MVDGLPNGIISTYYISGFFIYTIFCECLYGCLTVGLADLMLSIDGNEVHNLYMDPQVTYGSDQQWLTDLGRRISNDAAILGWYAFAGRTRVNNNSDFWIANPGVEVLGRDWDAHINAYIPLAGRSNGVNNTVELNSISEPFFTGHTEVITSVFDLANEIERIGNGAGFQYWFDQNIKFFSNYSYDNYQHSTVVVGLGVSFGGVSQQRADPTSLSERLTDPVERYMANWGHGSGINYPALDSTGTTAITLNAGQSVHSRTADYAAPATGTARSTFNGAFILNGGITGMSILASTAEITNSQLNVNGLGNIFGVNALSNATVNIADSNISVVSTGANANVSALATTTNASIQMELGTLLVTSPSPNAVITSGSMISPIGVACTLNGSSVTC